MWFIENKCRYVRENNCSILSRLDNVLCLWMNDIYWKPRGWWVTFKNDPLFQHKHSYVKKDFFWTSPKKVWSFFYSIKWTHFDHICDDIITISLLSHTIVGYILSSNGEPYWCIAVREHKYYQPSSNSNTHDVGRVVDFIIKFGNSITYTRI